MEADDSESPNYTSIYPKDMPSKCASSSINNFNDTFKEFVRKMSTNVQFSTPEAKSKNKIKIASTTSTYLNKELSSLDESSSSVILSGAILTSLFESNSSIPIEITPTPDKSTSNPAINTHVPVKIAPSSIVNNAPRYSSCTSISTSTNENIIDKTKTEFTKSTPIKTGEEKIKKISIVRKLFLATTSSTLPTFKLGNVQTEAKTDLALPFQIKTKPIVFTTASVKTAPVFTIVTKSKKQRTTTPSLPTTGNIPVSPFLLKPQPISYTTVPAKTVPVPVITKKRRITTPTVSSNIIAKNIQPNPPSTKPVPTFAVPATSEAHQITESKVTAKSVLFPLINSPNSDTTVFVKPSTISLVSKAAQIISSLANAISSKAANIEASSTIKTKDYINNGDNDEDFMEVEYLEEEVICSAKDRHKGTGKRNPPLKDPEQNSSTKKRPGRPRKPFHFDKILSSTKSIKLPNLFWSVSFNKKFYDRHVCFSRAPYNETENSFENDRVVKFTNSVEYSVQIDNRNVKLIAAPLTVNSIKDLQILLRVVNDIRSYDPMLEYF